MISGVQGLKIKPLAELKNDGIQKHTSIKSFITVLSSQKKKAENTSASKAAKESAKSDSSNADTTVNKSSDSDSTAGKILYKNASTGETYVYVDVADDKTSKTNKTSDTNTADAMKKTKYDSIFKKAAKKYGVSESLLKAVAKAESNFNPNDVSSAGAIGVMQLMPSTAKELGVTNPYDAEQNIMGGAKLIAAHLKKFNGDVRLALAAYNAGSGAVKKYGGVPSFCKTYVNRVLSYKKAYETANAVG